MGRSNFKKKKNAWNSSSIKNATIGLHETQLKVKLKKKKKQKKKQKKKTKKKNKTKQTNKKIAWNSSSWSSSSIKKCHYRTRYGAIRLKKKTCMF